MKHQELIGTLQGEIGWVILNRPQLHNAINLKMWSELPALCKQLSSDGARVIIIHGAEASFASGADLSELAQIKNYKQAQEYWQAINDCLEFVFQSQATTIAMIDGPCLGGGLLLAASCDLRYATHRSIFGIPVARLGVVLDDTILSRLTTHYGVALIKELILTGGTISSTKAESCGLINGMFATSALRQEVLNVANQILSNSSTVLTKCKASLRRITSMPYTGFEASRQESIESYLSSDFQQRIILNAASKK